MSTTALNVLDASADVVTVAVPIAKPIVQLISSFTPLTERKRGDEAQASTWTILEETENIMDRGTHDRLHARYDELLAMRQQLEAVGFLRSFKKAERRKNSAYASQAVKLNGATVTSSQLARTKNMWRRKQPVEGSDASNDINANTTDQNICNNDEDMGRRPYTSCFAAVIESSAHEHASVITADLPQEDPFRETASVIVSHPDWHEGFDAESVYSQDDIAVYGSQSGAHSYPPSLRIVQITE